MRLITQRSEVLARLAHAGRDRIPLLCPNAETTDEMEGILLAAEKHASAAGREQITIGLGFTATYPDHAQLRGLALGDRVQEIEETAERWLYWLGGYADRSGLFERVEVIPFLDHGWAPHPTDRHLMESPWFQAAMGIIMYDASASEFEDNVRFTSAYVESVRERVVVEACPDKVYERGEIEAKGLRESDLWSQPDRVEEFVRRTRVDLIVPNLGTEHRATSAASLDYQHDLAREIARRVGPIQSLHGTSSLGDRLGAVGADGICKVNYYTAMASAAAESVRSTWAAIPAGSALPISRACGSFNHRTRRSAIAEHVALVLDRLERAGMR